MFSNKRFILIGIIFLSCSIGAMDDTTLEKSKERNDETQLEKDKNEIISKTRTNSFDTPKKSVLIFLDDSELEIIDDSEFTIKAITRGLFAAMVQKPCPIIVSGSLIKTVFFGYDNSEYDKYKGLSLSDPKLIKLYEENEDDKNKNLKKFTSQQIKNDRYLYLRASQINPDEWIVKEIKNNALYLLIPKDYLQKNTINESDVIKDGIDEVLPVELQLGLKVNHMKTVSISEVIKLPVKKYYHTDFFIPALFDKDEDELDLDENKSYKSKVFCSLSDYITYNEKQKKDENFIQEPIWTMSMDGHGSMNFSIVGLSLYDFEAFLKFLKIRAINTQLLIYSSCYAAGTNTDLIYKEQAQEMQETYPFTIVTEALTDAVTYSRQTRIFNDNESLTFETKAQYDGFVKEVTKKVEKPEDVDHVYIRAIEKLFGSTKRLQCTPQIKAPGFEWFTPVDKTFSIGSILAKTRDPNIPLKISDDISSVLLYARKIPFELIINNNELLGIASMISGDSVHTIKKISSTDLNSMSLVQLFMNIKDLSVRKIFFIETIHGKDYKLSDVVIEYNDSQCRVWYVKESDTNNTYLCINDKYKETKIVNTDTKKLKPYEIYKETAKFEASIADIPNITKPYKIDEIIHPMFPLSNIFYAFKRKVKDEKAYFFVKKIIGLDDIGIILLDDIGIKDEDGVDIKNNGTIEIKDVIITKLRRHYCFFTVNEKEEPYKRYSYSGNATKTKKFDYLKEYPEPKIKGEEEQSGSNITQRGVGKLNEVFKNRSSGGIPENIRYEKKIKLALTLPEHKEEMQKFLDECKSLEVSNDLKQDEKRIKLEEVKKNIDNLLLEIDAEDKEKTEKWLLARKLKIEKEKLELEETFNKILLEPKDYYDFDVELVENFIKSNELNKGTNKQKLNVLLNVVIKNETLSEGDLEKVIDRIIKSGADVNKKFSETYPCCPLEYALVNEKTSSELLRKDTFITEHVFNKHSAKTITDKSEILKIAIDNDYSIDKIKFIVNELKAVLNKEIIKTVCEKSTNKVVNSLFVDYQFGDQETANICFELAVNNKNIIDVDDHTIDFRMFMTQQKFKPQITQELINKIPENHSIKSFLKEEFEKQKELIEQKN